MGLSASKRVNGSLTNSSEFDSACDSTYCHCLSLTQHAFPGVFPYQLSTASDYLHNNLSTVHPHPLVLKWIPSPPTRSLVDSALRRVRTFKPNNDSAAEDQILDKSRFKAWALELFSEAIVSNARKAVLCRVPVGIACIAGIGTLTRSRKDLVGTAIGVYAVGVATAIYVTLSA